MTIPEFEGYLAIFELHAPITTDDLKSLYTELREIVPAGISLDVVLRGTPDRKHDGEHRVEVTIRGAVDVVRSIPVQP